VATICSTENRFLFTANSSVPAGLSLPKSSPSKWSDLAVAAHFTDGQIIGCLKQFEDGMPVEAPAASTVSVTRRNRHQFPGLLEVNQ
jgi:hypothetical protein